MNIKKHMQLYLSLKCLLIANLILFHSSTQQSLLCVEKLLKMLAMFTIAFSSGILEVADNSLKIQQTHFIVLTIGGVNKF